MNKIKQILVLCFLAYSFSGFAQSTGGTTCETATPASQDNVFVHSSPGSALWYRLAPVSVPSMYEIDLVFVKAEVTVWEAPSPNCSSRQSIYGPASSGTIQVYPQLTYWIEVKNNTMDTQFTWELSPVAIPVYGCMDSTATNYNPQATVWSPNYPCTYDTVQIVYGCKDSTAYNYDPFADVHDQSYCKYQQVIYGCMDSLALNYNPQATAQSDNYPCEYAVYGCTDPQALNYNPSANVDDGSCTYAQDSTYFTLSENILNFNSKGGYLMVNISSNVAWTTGITGTGVSISPTSGSGNATVMIMVDTNFTPDTLNSTIVFYSGQQTVLASLAVAQSGEEQILIYGCMDSTALNYNPLATAQSANTPCIYPVYGCTDRFAENYTPNANTNDGTCIYKKIEEPISGCMDSTALNYNPIATVSDYNSCVFPRPEPQVIYGCTDPKALNYNPNATEYNNSCVYPEEENTYNEPITETPIDTLGARPKEDCQLNAGFAIVSASITNITIVNGQQIVARWEIVQANGNTIEYFAEYTIAQEGTNLFYLSIICKDGALQAKSRFATQSAVVVTGYTISATYNVDFATGIYQPNVETNNVVVYPNPFAEKLNVLVKEAKTADIALYSFEGKLLANYQNLSEVQMATNKLPAGVYVVKVIINGIVETVTVVKQ